MRAIYKKQFANIANFKRVYYLRCLKQNSYMNVEFEKVYLQSFRPYHPGELVKEELECRDIKQKDFAQRFGLSYSALNEVLNAKRSITTEFALVLEAALNINADLLVRMQTDYNIQVARKNNSLREKLNNIKKIAALL